MSTAAATYAPLPMASVESDGGDEVAVRRGRPPVTDPELVLYETLRRGSGRAFRRLLELHDPAMRRVASWYAPDPAEAAALVRETWAIALDGLGMFTWHTTFRAWLFGILVSVGRGAASAPRGPEHAGAGAAEVRVPVPRPTPTGPSAAVDWPTLTWDPRWTAASWRALDEGVAALPLPAREVVLLHEAEGWPLPEVLDVLQHTTAEGAALLRDGLARVRDAVTGHLGLTAPGGHPHPPRPATADEVAGLREALRARAPGPPDPPDSALLDVFRGWRTRRGIPALRRLGGAITAARTVPGPATAARRGR